MEAPDIRAGKREKRRMKKKRKKQANIPKMARLSRV
jgi:hypothetical protein